uniref:Integrase catalytic domain-containing protein n=1 Tax=Tanacetum cinerariifolium TaxID=118510 RepID=A0A6L2K137_TANCI|nr:hypothetical protein [Tanacetum cinerariifolium]
MDNHYPVRSAFSVLSQVIDEYQKKHGDSWKTVLADKTDQWPYLNDALGRFQNPAEADKLLKIQRELDETKIILPTVTIHQSRHSHQSVTIHQSSARPSTTKGVVSCLVVYTLVIFRTYVLYIRIYTLPFDLNNSIYESWMRTSRTKKQYIDGVEAFINYAVHNLQKMRNINPRGNKQQLMMPCPCTTCLNHIEHKVEEVQFHLFKYGIDLSYTKWDKHGEKDEQATTAQIPVNATTEFVDDTDLDMDFGLEIPTYCPTIVEMVSAVKESFDEDDLAKFQELLLDAEKPLYKGCPEFTKLFAIVKLLNLKGKYEASDKFFTKLLGLLKKMLLAGNEMVKKTYQAKRLMRMMGLGYKKIHICSNNCILYWKDNKKLTVCPNCRISRWKVDNKTHKVYENILAKTISTIQPSVQKVKKAFNGQQEFQQAVNLLTGEQIYNEKRITTKEDGSSNQGNEAYWKKFNIWYRKLRYWRHNSVSHCIDFMHVEKNVCESLVGTLLNVPGKTKDGMNARLDLAQLEIKLKLFSRQEEDKTTLPPAGKRIALLENEHNKSFVKWLREEVERELAISEYSVSETVRWIPYGPRTTIVKYEAYNINGYTFCTKSNDGIVYQNSGVSVEAVDLHISKEVATTRKALYYGVLQEIWVLDYRFRKIPLFKYDWVNHKAGGVKHDPNLGYTLINVVQVRVTAIEVKIVLLMIFKENISSVRVNAASGSYYCWLQKIVSQLAILGENISQKDLNMKFLRSLPAEWNTHVVVWRNKENLDTMASMIFTIISKLLNKNTNEVDTASIQVSAISTPVCIVSSLDNTVNLSDATVFKMIVSFAEYESKKVLSKTGKKITINGSDTAGYGKTKEEYFNCHKMENFARECKSPKNQESRPKNQDSSRKNMIVEDTSSKAMVVIDGTGFDWSYMADDEVPTNMALIAFADSEHPEFKGYRPKDSKSVCIDTSNEIKKAHDALIIEDWVFDSDEDEMVQKPMLKNMEKETVQKEVTPVCNNAMRTNHQNFSSSRRNFAPIAVLTKSGIVPISTAMQSSSRAAIPFSALCAARPINTAASKPLVNCALQDALKDQGYFNSGCSRNMTGNISYLADFKEDDGGYVAFGGGAKCGKITGKGTIRTGDKSQVLLKVPRKNNMYSFDMKNIVPQKDLTCLLAKATNDESMLWHRRLGHINFKNIKKLVKDNLMRGLPSKRFKNDQTCVACFKGKQHKVFFLATKDETSRILKSFITEIENLVEKKVKIIRCDNGTEFKNRVMNEFCEEKSIKREYSVARTPQQNRVAERRNRTLIEATRTMLSNSKLPTTFYAEAVSTACYVQNRVLVVKPYFKTLYELFKGGGPKWLFDLDALSKSMNYTLVSAALNSHNKDKHGPSQASESNNQERPNTQISTKTVNIARPVNTATPTYANYPNDPLIPDLEDVRIFNDAYDDRDEGADANYNNLETDVYVSQPLGFVDPKFPDRVYKVEKALYGLHQAPRAWYETLSTYLLDNGFRRGTINKTLFIKKMKDHILLVQVYADDIIFSSIKRSLSTEFEQLMHNRFWMSSMRELTFFLGLQVEQRKERIFLNQDKYVSDILKKFGFSSVKSASTPMETHKPLSKDANGTDVDVYLYRSMISSLMYLTSSRPDIMFTVCAYSRFQVQPKVSHMHIVKRIFRYLKGQPTLGLWYLKDSPLELIAYFDSDYTGASLDRKSTTGVCQFLGSRLISWQCKKQTILANSTTEAE